MTLDQEFLHRVAAIQWLSRCGERSCPQVRLKTQLVDDRVAALTALFSTQWADATTVAQGCLTGYLAKFHYDAYAHWNRLFKESNALLECRVLEPLRAAIHEGSWAASLARTPLPEITRQVAASIGTRMVELRKAQAWEQCLITKILVTINRASLEMTYRQKFHRAPIFFERVLEVYEAGHLPCGWEGDLDDWPDGKLLVH